MDAAVVERLDAAGAILVAKLTTGELAFGHNWFGGRTNNPWNPEEGSSGSSAGPGSATAAGLVRLRHWHRHGRLDSLTLRSVRRRRTAPDLRSSEPLWSDGSGLQLGQDRPDVPHGGRLRRCAPCQLRVRMVGTWLSSTDVPFNWDASTAPRDLRIGYFETAFDEDQPRESSESKEKRTAEPRGRSARWAMRSAASSFLGAA